MDGIDLDSRKAIIIGGARWVRPAALTMVAGAASPDERAIMAAGAPRLQQGFGGGR